MSSTEHITLAVCSNLTPIIISSVSHRSVLRTFHTEPLSENQLYACTKKSSLPASPQDREFRMKRLATIISLAILVLPALTFATDPFLLADSRFDFDKDISPGSWYWIHASNVDTGAGYYGSVTVDPGQDLDLFVCDVDGYNDIQSGKSTTPLHHWGEDLTGTTDFEFIAPDDGDLYFCFSNHDSVFTTIHIVGYISRDTTAPELDIISPNQGQTVKGTVVLEATAEDNQFEVELMRVYVDDSLKKTVTSDSITYYWDSTEVDDGAHTVKFYVSDNVNNEREIIRTVYVDNIIETTSTTGDSSTTSTTGSGSTTAQDPADQDPASNPPMLLSLPLIAGTFVVLGIAGAGYAASQKKKSTISTPVSEAKVFIICPYCGAKVEQGITKCHKCGAEI